MHQAFLYERLEDGAVRCNLCAHRCRVAEGKFGFCSVRQNVRGELYTRVYGKPVAQNNDPIEKKPFYHFLPGTYSYSIATIGCNFHCGFCQNWQISQVRFSDAVELPQAEVKPEDIVKAAVSSRAQSISYTYTEPTVFLEYALDIARLAKQEGLYNTIVTNGFMTPQAIETMKPFIDAANVDLKFYSDESYKRVCAGRLQPVLDAIRLMKEAGMWVEVTTLVVPGENDDESELRDIAGFIAGVDRSIPWHLSRFHPDFQFTDRDYTSEKILRSAVQIGRSAGLFYIYVGNVGGWGNDTHCHACARLLIKRDGLSVSEFHIKDGKCAFCEVKLPGVFR